MELLPEHSALIELLAHAAPRDTACWLVGGSVRDMLMGRPSRDVDIAVDSSPGSAAKRISEELGGSCFALDPAREIYRIVVKSPALQVDLSSVPDGIEADLSRRDFTINAMALPLCPDGPGELVDPYGGAVDIEERTVRAIGKRSLMDDPLRLLRAFRFEASLGFTIDTGTLGWIRELAYMISDVSPERVRDELYMMLETPEPSDAFRRMREAGLLAVILPEAADMECIPQPPPHEHELMEHAMRSMHHAALMTSAPDAYFGDHSADVMGTLSAPAEPPLTMRGLTVLCAFLHDIGKPVTMKEEDGLPRFIGHDSAGADMASALSLRLRTSAYVREMLETVTRHHMRPLMLSRRQTTGRALHRLARDAGGAVVPLMTVALADALATRERPGTPISDVEGFISTMLEYYFRDYTSDKENPLITGRDLIDVFGLEPGPLFGRILEDVEEARADGALADRDAAIVYVRANLERYRA